MFPFETMLAGIGLGSLAALSCGDQLGDKTQLAVITLVKFVPESVIKKVAAAAFVVIGVLMYFNKL